jgi:hypothetical protein
MTPKDELGLWPGMHYIASQQFGGYDCPINARQFGAYGTREQLIVKLVYRVPPVLWSADMYGITIQMRLSFDSGHSALWDWELSQSV